MDGASEAQQRSPGLEPATCVLSISVCSTLLTSRSGVTKPAMLWFISSDDKL